MRKFSIFTHSIRDNFFLGGPSVRGRVQLRAAGVSEGGAGTAALEEDTEEDPFAVRAGRFIYGSGAFFALKIQSAKSVQQLEEFAKEAENLEKLRGHSHAVQIRDHTIIHESRHVVILMELAACDLHTFFKRLDYSFGAVGTFSIWHSLVRAVDAAHKQEIIHRDLKPQNFLLVPIAPPFADTILATTLIPREKFEFRIVNKHTGDGPDSVVEDDSPDVELILRDQQTGAVRAVLQLVVKVSDFGLAEPLDLDASHLSVRGHAGTIKYMAPETFRPSVDGIQRLCKRVDVWAVGIMLFQMLHGGRTPYDRYCTNNDNNVRAAVAIQSDFIHKEVMKFERQKVWDGEKKTLQRDLRTLRTKIKNMDDDAASRICRSVTAMSLLSTEFLFRMCEKCLAFEASDRPTAAEVKVWVGHLLDREWWQETMANLSDIQVQALLSGVSVEDVGNAESRSECQLNARNLAQNGGARIEQVFFPELQRVSARHAGGDIVVLSAGEEPVEGCEKNDHEARLSGVVLPARGDSVEEREESDDGAAHLQAVVLPARGDSVEEREESDDGAAHLQAVVLPARGEPVEEREESDDGAAHRQAVVLPGRGEPVEEREGSDGAVHLQAVALPTRGEPVEEREESNGRAHLQAVLLPARGEPGEECEVESDVGAYLQAVVLPEVARGDCSVEEREQNDDGAHRQAAVRPAARRDSVEEREECDGAAHRQASVLPDPARGDHPERIAFGSLYSCHSSSIIVLPAGRASGPEMEEREVERDDDASLQTDVVLAAKGAAVGECEESDEEPQLQAAQELLPRFIKEEDCGLQGIRYGSERPKERARPERRTLALEPSGSCGCSIFGIIVVTISVLAVVGLFIFVVVVSKPKLNSPGNFLESVPGPSGVVDVDFITTTSGPAAPFVPVDQPTSTEPSCSSDNGTITSGSAAPSVRVDRPTWSAEPSSDNGTTMSGSAAPFIPFDQPTSAEQPCSENDTAMSGSGAPSGGPVDLQPTEPSSESAEPVFRTLLLRRVGSIPLPREFRCAGVGSSDIGARAAKPSLPGHFLDLPSPSSPSGSVSVSVSPGGDPDRPPSSLPPMPLAATVPNWYFDLLEDEDSGVRRKAVEDLVAFVEKGDTDTEVVDAIDFIRGSCLADGASCVRIQAVKALAQLAKRGDVAVILAFSRLVLYDLDDSVRIEAVKALPQLAEKGIENRHSHLPVGFGKIKMTFCLTVLDLLADYSGSFPMRIEAVKEALGLAQRAKDGDAEVNPGGMAGVEGNGGAMGEIVRSPGGDTAGDAGGTAGDAGAGGGVAGGTGGAVAAGGAGGAAGGVGGATDSGHKKGEAEEIATMTIPRRDLRDEFVRICRDEPDVGVLVRLAEKASDDVGADEVVIATLSGLIVDKEDFVVRTGAIQALAHFSKPGDAQVITAFSDLLADIDHYLVRIEAIWALSALAERGDAKVITVFLGLLADNSSSVRGREARPQFVDEERALSEAEPVFVGDQESVVRFLSHVRRNSRAHETLVREEVLKALARLAEKGRTDVIEAILGLLAAGESSVDVRIEAYKALAHYIAEGGSPEVIDAISDLLDVEKESDVRREALRVLDRARARDSI